MPCESCNNAFEVVDSNVSCNCNNLPGTVSQQDVEEYKCCVVSVNGKKGIVILNINDIDLLGNQFFSNNLVYAALSGISPINLNGSGQISHLPSGVAPGTYGSTTQIPIITVDSKGHVTSIANTNISTSGLSVNLQNLDGLVGVGYLVKTAANTWAFRSLQGAAGRIEITQPLGTGSNSVIDLKNGIVTPGTYGNSSQYPVITVDTYGRVTGVSLQTSPAGADNWGTQVVQHDATLSGQGITGNLLKLAQQGATLGQFLRWNGTTWAPANPFGDNWGSQVVEKGEFLAGNGLVATPIELDQVTKIEDALYGPGGITAIHAVTLTGWNLTYGGAPISAKTITARLIFRIEILATSLGAGISEYITIYFEGAVIYKLEVVDIVRTGVVTPEIVIDQSITDTNNVFTAGLSQTLSSTVEILTSLPTYEKVVMTGQINPEIEIEVGPNIIANVGATYKLDRNLEGKYIVQ